VVAGLPYSRRGVPDSHSVKNALGRWRLFAEKRTDDRSYDAEFAIAAGNVLKLFG